MKVSLYLIPFLFFTGCLTGSEGIDPLFGYLYKIDPSDQYPVINEDSLEVRLLYSGCHRNHEFTLQHKVISQGLMELWLHKNTPNQSCEAAFGEARSFKLPPEVFAAKEVYLIGPEDTRIRIR